MPGGKGGAVKLEEIRKQIEEFARRGPDYQYRCSNGFLFEIEQHALKLLAVAEAASNRIAENCYCDSGGRCAPCRDLEAVLDAKLNALEAGE